MSKAWLPPFVMLTLLSASVLAQDASVLMKRAFQAHQQGHYDEAIDGYNEALKQDLTDKYRFIVLVNTGVAYNSKREWSNAISLFKQAQAIDAQKPESWRFMGQAYLGLGQVEEAIKHFSRAIEASPAEGTYRETRADIYFRTKEYALAIEDMSEAIRLHPRQASFYAKRGSIYFAINDFGNTEKDYTKALELNPKDAVTYNNRGALYKSLRDWENAIKNLDKAIQLNPNYAEALSNRAQCHMDLAQVEEAIPDYEQAIKKDPGDVTSLTHLAFTLASHPDDSIRDGERAVQLANAACELTRWNNVTNIKTLAIAYAELGDFDIALRHVDQAISLTKQQNGDPTHLQEQRALFIDNRPYRYQPVAKASAEAAEKAKTAVAWLMAASRARNQNDDSRALEYLEQALKSQPNIEEEALANANKAQIFFTRQQWDKAIEVADKAIKLAPQDGDYFQIRAMAFKSKGEATKAIEDFNTVIKLKPDYFRAYHDRGHTYADMREWKKAEQDYNHAIELNDVYATAYINRAELYRRTGRIDEAIKDLGSAIKLAGDNAKAWSFRALCHYNMKNWGEALKDIEASLMLDDTNNQLWGLKATILGMAPDISIRNGAEAVKAATRAGELDKWSSWEHFYQLAGGHAESGDFDEALRVLDRAMALPNLDKNNRTILENQAQSYLKKKVVYMDAAL